MATRVRVELVFARFCLFSVLPLSLSPPIYFSLSLSLSLSLSPLSLSLFFLSLSLSPSLSISFSLFFLSLLSLFGKSLAVCDLQLQFQSRYFFSSYGNPIWRFGPGNANFWGELHGGGSPNLSQNVPFCPLCVLFCPSWGPERGQIGTKENKRGQNGTFQHKLGNAPI